jgi:hypothetical protein
MGACLVRLIFVAGVGRRKRCLKRTARDFQAMAGCFRVSLCAAIGMMPMRLHDRF